MSIQYLYVEAWAQLRDVPLSFLEDKVCMPHHKSVVRKKACPLIVALDEKFHHVNPFTATQ